MLWAIFLAFMSIRWISLAQHTTMHLNTDFGRETVNVADRLDCGVLARCLGIHCRYCVPSRPRSDATVISDRGSESEQNSV